MIPASTLRTMATNFTNRAEQHEKLGDAAGAEKYRRLAADCREKLQDIAGLFSAEIEPARLKGEIDGLVSMIEGVR